MDKKYVRTVANALKKFAAADALSLEHKDQIAQMALRAGSEREFHQMIDAYYAERQEKDRHDPRTKHLFPSDSLRKLCEIGKCPSIIPTKNRGGQ